MISIKIEKGRLKVGKYSLSNLAIGEAIAAAVIVILTLVIGWNAYKDARCYYAWNGALVAYASKDPGNAATSLQKAIDFRPEFPPPHEMVAKMATDKDDFAGARESYDRLVKLDPTNQAAQIGYGVICLKEWDRKPGNQALLKQAKDAFAAAEGNSDAKIGLGNVFLRTGDITGAEKAFNEAEKMDRPPSLDGLLDLYVGQMHIAMKRGEFNKARDYAERARFVNPSNVRPLANIAYLQAKRLRGLDLTREKFLGEAERLRLFKEQVYMLYQTDAENLAFLKPALLEFVDAYSGLALRSTVLATASTEARFVRGIDQANKRLALNYIQTLAAAARSPILLDDERRQYLGELESAISEAEALFKDITTTERCLLKQMMSCRYLLDQMDYNRAYDNADKARELMENGASLDSAAQAAIWRTLAVARWQRARTMDETGAKYKEFAQVCTDGEKAQALDSRPEMDEFIRRVKNEAASGPREPQ